MAYGWQIFDANGRLVADQSVIMSRRLGTYTIPFIRSAWKTRINVNFNGGTPFAHCSVITGVVTPSDGFYWGAPPDIYCGPDYIDLGYPARFFNYPSQNWPGYVGNMIVHYGVYTA